MVPTGLHSQCGSKMQVEAKGLWEHFDGTITQLAISTPPVTGEEEAFGQQVKEDCMAKALLTHCSPNSTLKLSLCNGFYTFAKILTNHQRI